MGHGDADNVAGGSHKEKLGVLRECVNGERGRLDARMMLMGAFGGSSGGGGSGRCGKEDGVSRWKDEFGENGMGEKGNFSGQGEQQPSAQKAPQMRPRQPIPSSSRLLSSKKPFQVPPCLN